MPVINDGFGDDRRDVDFFEQTLLDNERLLRLKAADRLRGHPAARDIYDDLLQEGRIVAWQVLQKRPDAPRAYVSAAMSNRMNEVLSRGQRWTGMETRRGHPLDPLRRPAERDSIDDPTVDVVVSSGNWVEQIQMAYHDGEIAQALASLTFTQRQQVVARFFYGLTEPEIAALQGCSVATVSRHWTQEIRPVLLQQLGHLE